jgi:hypothetical protein
MSRDVGRHRQRQRTYRVDLLAGNAERLTAGGDDLDASATREQCIDQLDHCIDHVLAVVEHDQHALLGQASGKPRCQIRFGLLADAEGGRHHRRHARRVLQRREIDEPDAVRKLMALLLRQLQRQPRLAATADTGQRQKPRVLQQARAVRQRRFATDKAGSLLREVGGRHRATYARAGR